VVTRSAFTLLAFLLLTQALLFAPINRLDPERLRCRPRRLERRGYELSVRAEDVFVLAFLGEHLAEPFACHEPIMRVRVDKTRTALG
jgi:hypothetical protein